MQELLQLQVMEEFGKGVIKSFSLVCIIWKSIVTGHITPLERERGLTLELLPGYCCSLYNNCEIKIRVFSVDGDIPEL